MPTNQFAKVPFSEMGLRSVLGRVIENINTPALLMDAMEWQAAYDKAPVDQNHVGNAPNQFLVGLAGVESISIMRFGVNLSRSDAVNLAAYLSVLADPLDKSFGLVRRAVQST